MTKITAGQQWESGDKLAKKPLKSAAELAAVEKTATATDWKFPATLAEAFALLKEVSAAPVVSEDEWESAQPKLKALKLHVYKLQQGLPVVAAKSSDFNHSHMHGVMRELQLRQLVRTNPVIGDLMKENESLKKELEDLKAGKTATTV